MIYYFMFIIFVLVIIYLACRLLILKRAIQKVSRELREISLELDENRVVKMPVPEKELEELLEGINQNLEAIRIERRNYQQEELKLKEQIENISHDLRTPLTAVLGYLKMIDTEEMDSEHCNYLQTAINKSYTLQNLVSQFYELSRVNAENFHLKLEPVNAVRILKEICLEYYGLFEKEQLIINMSLKENSFVISGGEEALKRVFSNLIQNAIRYAKSELNIQVESGLDGETVQFIFSNDIEAEQEISDPERLFDRFYMQEQSRNHGGTGLGLTISKSLVEHMNGTIHAVYSGESEKRFLTFTIQFHKR